MNLTNRDFVQAANFLFSSSELLDKKFPVSLIMALHHNCDVARDYAEVYNAAHDSIIKNYDTSERDEALRELLNETAEISFRTVNACIFEEWDDEKFDPLTLKIYNGLQFMVKSEGEDDDDD